MKQFFKFELTIFFLAFATFLITSCKEKIKENTKDIALNTLEEAETIKVTKKQLTEAFKAYWYSGTAEITSYELEQARYGELRKGKAALIYVTEPFLADKQVKADGRNPDNISVLKLNSTKSYLTGVYPYSIMSSSFYPVQDNAHAVKVSASVQEWCGHVYMQLNNRASNFEVTSHSYFESEADQNLSLDKTLLEDEIWNKIRISPTDLPVGNQKMIPSLEFIRLRHKELKAYDAITSLKTSEKLSSYAITYPTLERTLTITFTTDFPHTIESWSETSKSGFGSKAKSMTSTGKKIKSIKSPYWSKNHNSDLYLRDSLGL